MEGIWIVVLRTRDGKNPHKAQSVEFYCILHVMSLIENIFLYIFWNI